eukprot:4567486-Prymnesium_polylepis.1
MQITCGCWAAGSQTYIVHGDRTSATLPYWSVTLLFLRFYVAGTRQLQPYLLPYTIHRRVSRARGTRQGGNP